MDENNNNPRSSYYNLLWIALQLGDIVVVMKYSNTSTPQHQQHKTRSTVQERRKRSLLLVFGFYLSTRFHAMKLFLGSLSKRDDVKQEQHRSKTYKSIKYIYM